MAASKIMERRLMVFFILSHFVYNSEARLYCYSCATTQQIVPNKTVKSCSYFDKSAEFEEFCQFSTFCMKKTSEYMLQNGQKVRVEERGCANQKYTHYIYESGWVSKEGIQEDLYKEGCFFEDQRDLKAAQSEYCYCASSLCNSGIRATETSFFHHTDAMSVIFIFNVIKFMRSIR